MAPSRAKILNELYVLLVDHLEAVGVHERALAYVKRLEEGNAATKVVKHFTAATIEVSAAKVMLTRAAFAQAVDDAGMPSHVINVSFLGEDFQTAAAAMAEKIGRRVQVMKASKPFSATPKKLARELSSLHDNGAVNGGTATIGFKIEPE